MDLLVIFLMILSHCSETFYRKKTFKRAPCHVISSLCALGCHTITNILTFAGKDDPDWSSGCQIEHHRHRSPWNFFVNLISGIVAYAYDSSKPSIRMTKKEKQAFLETVLKPDIL